MRVIVLIMAGLLLSPGCVENPEKTARLSKCDEKQDQKFKDMCYVNVATELKDHSICQNLEKQNYRDVCYGRVGVSKKDESICEMIKDEKIRRECHLFATQ